MAFAADADDDKDCKFVHHFNTSQERCDFVVNNTDCQEASGFLNYVTVLYCNFEDEEPLGLFLLSLWLAFLFVGLAVSADDFFCPNLHTISKTLRLSHNIAGITILAFGNGAPDIFSSFASVSQSRPELLLGELFGAGVFVTTVVAGSICIAKPFKLMERPFLRDVVFYLFAGFWAFYIFYRGEIRLSDSLGFLVMYVVYLSVVLVGRFVHQRMRRRLLAEALLYQEEDESPDPTFNVFVPPENPLRPEQDVQVHTDETAPETTEDNGHDDVIREPEISLATIGEPIVRPEVDFYGWRKLGQAVIPSGLISRRTRWYQRLWEMVKLPYFLVFSLTIPICETEEDDHEVGEVSSNGGNEESISSYDKTWSQYLHVVQCIAAPQFIAFAIGYGFQDLDVDPSDQFHVWEIIFVAGLISAIVLLCSTSIDRPPSWRPLLSFVGFGVAVVWIYALANEIVALLKVFGVALGFSDAILGLTLLAWGNSISDLVADVAVARRGFPRMGFSASFGGPLFNLLLGIGLPFTVQFLKKGSNSVQVVFNPMVLVLSASLAAALLASFLILPMAKFRAGKCHGIFLLALYVGLLGAAIGVELSFGGFAVKQKLYYSS